MPRAAGARAFSRHQLLTLTLSCCSVYDWEMTPSHGAQNFTNLAFGGDLDALDWAWGNHSIVGLWDFNGLHFDRATFPRHFSSFPRGRHGSILFGARFFG